MMSGLQIRRGGTGDAIPIADIIESVWPDTETRYERLVQVLSLLSHVTLVAIIDGVTAGFVNGFMTTSAVGKRRWEVDLLAVHPFYQRRGIGRALVKALTTEGARRDATAARGLIAVGNTGSERAFEVCGYSSDGLVYALMVAKRPAAVKHDMLHEAFGHFIVVTTLTYNGIWVEGVRSSSTFAQALARVTERGGDVVGSVIPTAEKAALDAAQAFGFEAVGHYRWWQCPLNHD